MGCEQSVPVQEDFVLRNYAGRWNQVAYFPNWFQKDCGKSVAVYLPIQGEPNKVRVINICFDPETGKESRMMKGTAELWMPSEPGVGKGELWVHFDWIPSWPMPNYKIIWTDYNNYSIVESDCGKYLWILTRHNQISDQTYNLLVQTVQRLGYDASKLIRTL